jgi:hypothetical protein
MNRYIVLIFIALLLAIMPYDAAAQTAGNQLAATLEVLSANVEVRRVNTVNWINVKIEAIVGVGDTIRTNANGRARVTFFAGGTETDILPNTEYVIRQFEGSSEKFNLSVEVVAGQTLQRLGKLLDATSSYKVQTPGMALTARGTQFVIRVENGGRSAMLVSEGEVQATKDQANADIPPNFGIRAPTSGALSDVVQAKSFEELDAALDGCSVLVTTPDDTRLNVRLGPSVNFPRVGTIAAEEVVRSFGIVNAGSWYRIEFRGGFGWVLSSSAKIQGKCAGLRKFADNYGPEDAGRYTSLGDPIKPEDLTQPTGNASPEATATPSG